MILKYYAGNSYGIRSFSPIEAADQCHCTVASFFFRVNRCFNCIAEARQGPTNDISMRDFDENKSKLFYSFLKPGNGFEDAENQTQIFRLARPPTMLQVWQ